MAAMHQPIFDARARDASIRPRDETEQPVDAQWSASAERLAHLMRTIEGEVIPRLVLAHRNVYQPSALLGTKTKLPTTDDVAELAGLAIDHDAAFLTTHVQKLRAQGMPVESVYLDLLAPTARYLGQMWDDDRCDFTAVTMGLWKLQQVLRNLSTVFQGEVTTAAEEHRALLVSMPGEQHTFGLFIVAEFFRRAGWEVLDSPMQTCGELVDVVRRERFALAGLSIARDGALDELTALIAELRLASRNQDIKILVGGPAFLESPQLVRRVGADATASNGRNAVQLAQDMLSIPLRSC